MSQMHFQGEFTTGVSVYSAVMKCDRCGKLRACVALQAADAHYQQKFCKEDCWKDLLTAIAADEELAS